MTYRRRIGPDYVEEAARLIDFPRSGSGPHKEDGAIAMASAIVVGPRDEDEERSAARMVVRRSFGHGHDLVTGPDGTRRLVCSDPAAHAAERAAARVLLDVLGLLPAPPKPVPAPELTSAKPKAAVKGPSGSAARRAARVAEFRRLVRGPQPLEPEEAAAVIGVAAETARGYMHDIEEDERRSAYFEARGLNYSPRDAGDLAGLPDGGWREHEGAWQARLAAQGGAP